MTPCNEAPAVTIALRRSLFGEAETEIARTERIRVSAFTYPSGVEALRVTTPRVVLELLPFRGQQVWHYCVDGENLTMRTHFEYPAASTDFAATYGPFLLHCGLTGIGHPGPDDTHAHHGELPNIRFDQANLELRTGTASDSVTLTGSASVRSSHSLDLEFTPRLTVSSDSTALHVSATITNHRRTEAEYSYLCHINWPLSAATLVQSCHLDDTHFRVYPTGGATPDTAAYIEQITADPAAASSIDQATPLHPEYCALLRPETDGDGWAHFMMLRDDGTAPCVRYRVEYLPYAIRWLSNTGDEVAAGFCLPTTAHHQGRNLAAAEGMMVHLGPGQSHVMEIVAELLDPAQAQREQALIEGILS
ncbi:DUF4432 family protein [Schaalia suimastitidis]|uniref:DUF4432 family protein n=1 Tax=Schaalia suimastitidis TaxID=121163 RepID=UPI0003FBCFE0|nr:DUF4432 family protein [Schaalia suimastitidis]